MLNYFGEVSKVLRGQDQLLPTVVQIPICVEFPSIYNISSTPYRPNL